MAGGGDGAERGGVALCDDDDEADRRRFQRAGGSFQIEPDASSGSYFWAAGSSCSRGSGWVSQWRSGLTDWQMDAAFPRFLPLPSKHFPADRPGRQHHDSDRAGAVLGSKPVRFTDLGRLRVQECERVVALRTELTKCGAKVIEEGDTLTVYPSQLHGAEIETYNDHRMAMCFAILGLKVPGIKIKNPSCVKKTFPNFFQKLAAPPPAGLGARILDGKSGRTLSEAELFAE